MGDEGRDGRRGQEITKYTPLGGGHLQAGRRCRPEPRRTYFHSQPTPLALPCSSTSHSKTTHIAFSRASFGDCVCMKRQPRHFASIPFPVGWPRPSPCHVIDSPSLVIVMPWPLP